MVCDSLCKLNCELSHFLFELWFRKFQCSKINQFIVFLHRIEMFSRIKNWSLCFFFSSFLEIPSIYIQSLDYLFGDSRRDYIFIWLFVKWRILSKQYETKGCRCPFYLCQKEHHSLKHKTAERLRKILILSVKRFAECMEVIRKNP